MYDYRPYVKKVTNKKQIVYECDKGYFVSGPPGATCVDGQWSPRQLPACLRGSHPVFNWFQRRRKRSPSGSSSSIIKSSSTIASASPEPSVEWKLSEKTSLASQKLSHDSSNSYLNNPPGQSDAATFKSNSFHLLDKERSHFNSNRQMVTPTVTLKRDESLSQFNLVGRESNFVSKSGDESSVHLGPGGHASGNLVNSNLNFLHSPKYKRFNYTHHNQVNLANKSSKLPDTLKGPSDDISSKEAILYTKSANNDHQITINDPNINSYSYFASSKGNYNFDKFRHFKLHFNNDKINLHLNSKFKHFNSKDDAQDENGDVDGDDDENEEDDNSDIKLDQIKSGIKNGKCNNLMSETLQVSHFNKNNCTNNDANLVDEHFLPDEGKLIDQNQGASFDETFYMENNNGNSDSNNNSTTITKLPLIYSSSNVTGNLQFFKQLTSPSFNPSSFYSSASSRDESTERIKKSHFLSPKYSTSSEMWRAMRGRKQLRPKGQSP